MKPTTIFHCLAATVTACLTLHAETLTVDNRPNAVAMYSDLGDAINAAENSDTIQIAGSSSSYGIHQVYKPLHFRGPGYFLSENGVEGLNQRSARVDLHFYNDSNKGSASGSTARFLDGGFVGFSSSGLVNYSVSYCRGYVSGSPFAAYPRVTVRNCFLTSGFSLVASGSSISDSIVSSVDLPANTIADRCIFTSGASTRTDTLASISDSLFIVSSSNNVSQFNDRNDGSVSHCMAIGATYLPSGNGNINQQFANVVFQQGNSPDGQYKLKTGSPAIAAGRNGGDLGAFGGVNPYRLSGLPSIPRITNLAIDAVATDANGLTFNVDAVAVGTTSE